MKPVIFAILGYQLLSCVIMLHLVFIHVYITCSFCLKPTIKVTFSSVFSISLMLLCNNQARLTAKEMRAKNKENPAGDRSIHWHVVRVLTPSAERLWNTSACREFICIPPLTMLCKCALNRYFSNGRIGRPPCIRHQRPDTILDLGFKLTAHDGHENDLTRSTAPSQSH